MCSLFRDLIAEKFSTHLSSTVKRDISAECTCQGRLYGEIKYIFLLKNSCVCMLSRFSHVQLFVTPWTVALQASLSMGFSRQVYWRGLPCPPPGDLPNPGIQPRSSASQADSYHLSHQGSPSSKKKKKKNK